MKKGCDQGPARDEERKATTSLRWSAKPSAGKKSRTVRPIACLMAHQRIIAFIGLNDGWCFEVEFIPSMDNRVQLSDVFVEAGEVDVTRFSTIAIRVESISCAIFVIGKDAEILRPVSEWSDGIDECVWTGDVWGCSEALE